LEGGYYLRDLEVDGKIIFNLILEQEGMIIWTAFRWLSVLLVADSCEHGNEPSDSIKGGDCFIVIIYIIVILLFFLERPLFKWNFVYVEYFC